VAQDSRATGSDPAVELVAKGSLDVLVVEDPGRYLTPDVIVDVRGVR
jgi:hypothetical protein